MSTGAWTVRAGCPPTGGSGTGDASGAQGAHARRGERRLRAMTDTVDNLILDLLEWLGAGPRPYADVLDAWRTSCPRLPVWEEANDRGFVARAHAPGTGQLVLVTESGARHLRACRGQALRTS